MKQKLYLLIVIFISLFSFGQTLDQSNSPSDIGGGSFTLSASSNVGQSFTAGLTGDLSQVNIRIGNWSSVFVAGDFQLRIFEGDGYGGAILNTTTFTIGTTPVSSDYQELTIPLSANTSISNGGIYTIDLRGITGAVSTHGTSANYMNGGFYFNGGNNVLYNSYDLWFKTFVIPQVVSTTPASYLNFDGVNDRVELENESNFDFTNTFS